MVDSVDSVEKGIPKDKLIIVPKNSKADNMFKSFWYLRNRPAVQWVIFGHFRYADYKCNRQSV